MFRFSRCAALLVISVFMLTACNTTPYDRATVFYDRSEFPRQLAKDLGISELHVSQHGRCSAILTTPGSNRGVYYFCTFALTPEALYVMGWNATTLSYQEIATIKLAELKEVAYEKILRTSQVQLVEAQRVVALSVMIDEGGYHATNESLLLFESLKQMGAREGISEGMINPPPAPAPIFIPVVVPR